MKRAAVVVLVGILALAGCAKPRVVTQPEMPPLAPPAPPPRVVAPPETEEPSPPAKTPETPARRHDRPAPRPEPARDAQKTEASKPPAKPEIAPVPVEPPAGPVLQTAPPADLNQMQRQAETLLNQAKSDLDRVNAKTLSPDLKGQYDTAQRFIEQGRQALKDQNPVLAVRLGDKASTIAAAIAAAVVR
jgi:hypothetical protein